MFYLVGLVDRVLLAVGDARVFAPTLYFASLLAFAVILAIPRLRSPVRY